uniref:Ig-like domain-containing protein n=1 Tax=Nothobranchius furzeri TaxID=105023 RepID=A0A8C6NLS0_NOTFU
MKWLTMEKYLKILSAPLEIIQTPMVVKHQGEEAIMECTQSKGEYHVMMFWLKKLPGGPIRQVVYNIAFNKPLFEPDFNDGRFSIMKLDHFKGNVTVKKLVLGDDGLYYCALSIIWQGVSGW